MSQIAKQETPQATKKINIYWIHVIVILFFIFGFGYLPPIAPLEKLGMQVLGIFIGMLYGWTFVSFIWPSLMGLLALGLTEYSTVARVIKDGIGDGITMLVLFLFIFAAYLDHIGVSSAIANWFISRKIAVGRPWIFSTMVLLAAYALGATVSLFAGIVLVWNIFYKICDLVGFVKGDRYPTIMLIGIVYAAMLGFAIFPFKVLQVMVLGSLEKVSGLNVNFMDFTLVTFLITVVCLIVFLLMCRFIFRPDVTPLTNDVDHFAHLRNQKLNSDQKLGAIFLIFFMIAMFIPSILPKTVGISSFFGKLGTTGSIIFVVAILAILKTNGHFILDFAQMAKGINWDMVILFFATMPVSQAMSSPDTGVMDFIIQLLEPVFSGMSPLVFAVFFLLIGGVITQVAHNLVLGALMTPILYRFCIQFGLDPLLLTTLFVFILGIAIATPGGSAPGALIYVNREWISAKSAYGYCAIIALVNLLITIGIGLPLGKIFF